MNGKNRNIYLLRNTIIFAIGNFATKFITFFLMPLYTNCLTTSEYGKIDLLYTVCTFLYPLLTLNISEAIFRFSMDKEENNNEVLTIGFLCTFFGIILGMLSIPIIKTISGYSQFSYLFYTYLITTIISQTLLVSLKGMEQLKQYTLGNFINTFFIALFNIVFLLKLKMGIEGYFLAYIISNLIASIYAICIVKPLRKKYKINKILLKKMIKYSMVLLPTTFMWWIINSSDKIMITSIISSSANGIYSISYKIPSLLTTIASIFNQAWIFSAISQKDSIDNEKFTNRVFNILFLIIVIVGVFILLLIKPLFRVYIGNDYYLAWKYVPFLIFGFVFMTSATFISTSYNVYKDSKGFLISGLIGAISNIIMNIILIPILKVYGAALATCLSYIIVFCYRLFDTRKYVKIHFDKNYILPIFLLFTSCILIYIDNIYGIILQIIEVIIILIIYKNYIKMLLEGIVRIKSRLVK